MSQVPLKVTIFGASTGNLGRSVVFELGLLFSLDLTRSVSRRDLHDPLPRRG